MVAPRIDGPDWDHVGWHYKTLHRFAPLWQDRLVDARVSGIENLPREGGFLYAANHTSWWDPFILCATIGRPINWLAKKEAMPNRLARWFFEGGGCIPVDRDATRNDGAVNAARRALADGRVIGIFPEGTRNDGVNLLRPKSGVGHFALAAGVPVVPAGILTDRFWPRSRRAPNLKEPVYVAIGQPLMFDGDAEDAKAARAAAEHVMDEIARLLEDARLARDAGAEWTRVSDLPRA